MFTCFKRANDELITEVQEKPYCTSISMVGWRGYKDFRDFFGLETANLEVLTKEIVHLDYLRHWQNTDVNRRLLVDFF